MAKFNLKDYVKINGDEHIDQRLKEDHGKIPDEVNEAQLENYRATEPTQLTEKQLEKVRAGEAEQITERRLDNDKAKFANKYRNEEAYNGDINKLEQKRLESDPVEDQVYESSSETPKFLRWWENTPKSPDGLKTSQRNKKKVDAQMGRAREFEPSDEQTDINAPEFKDISPEEKMMNDLEKSDFDIIEVEDAMPNLEVVKEKNLTGEIPGVYMVVEYDVTDFGGVVDDIQKAVLDKILEVRPELRSLISTDDLSMPKEEGAVGQVTLRAFGDYLRPVLPMAEPTEEEALLEKINASSLFKELSYEQKDVGGTPMVLGKIKVMADVDDYEKDQVVEDAVSFIGSKHPDIKLSADAIDVSKLSEGELGYMVMASLREEFKVTDVTPVKTAAVKKN